MLRLEQKMQDLTGFSFMLLMDSCLASFYLLFLIKEQINMEAV